jgi:hypothetical protein
VKSVTGSAISRADASSEIPYFRALPSGLPRSSARRAVEAVPRMADAYFIFGTYFFFILLYVIYEHLAGEDFIW